jgi:hypothetical protein
MTITNEWMSQSEAKGNDEHKGGGGEEEVIHTFDVIQQFDDRDGPTLF